MLYRAAAHRGEMLAAKHPSAMMRTPTSLRALIRGALITRRSAASSVANPAAAGGPHRRFAVVAAATAIAQTIARQAPLGVQATLRQSRLSRDVSTDAAIADMHASLVPIMTSEDAAEGLRSFVERRDGVYQGK